MEAIRSDGLVVAVSRMRGFAGYLPSQVSAERLDAVAGLVVEGEVEVRPAGIGLFDQPYLPGALPFLDLVFAGLGAVAGFVGFEPNEACDTVFLCEYSTEALFVEPDAL